MLAISSRVSVILLWYFTQ